MRREIRKELSLPCQHVRVFPVTLRLVDDLPTLNVALVLEQPRIRADSPADPLPTGRGGSVHRPPGEQRPDTLTGELRARNSGVEKVRTLRPLLLSPAPQGVCSPSVVWPITRSASVEMTHTGMSGSAAWRPDSAAKRC